MGADNKLLIPGGEARRAAATRSARCSCRLPEWFGSIWLVANMKEDIMNSIAQQMTVGQTQGQVTCANQLPPLQLIRRTDDLLVRKPVSNEIDEDEVARHACNLVQKV